MKSVLRYRVWMQSVDWRPASLCAFSSVHFSLPLIDYSRCVKWIFPQGSWHSIHFLATLSFYLFLFFLVKCWRRRIWKIFSFMPMGLSKKFKKYEIIDYWHYLRSFDSETKSRRWVDLFIWVSFSSQKRNVKKW